MCCQIIPNNIISVLGAAEIRKNRVLEIHISAVDGDINMDDAKIGWPDIRDIPQVIKCVRQHATCIYVKKTMRHIHNMYVNSFSHYGLAVIASL